jgi:hypothetical protein
MHKKTGAGLQFHDTEIAAGPGRDRTQWRAEIIPR